MSFVIKVHPNNVGRLIGPKGTTIRNLQQEYNVRISISKENDQDGMREAEVSGDQDCVDTAVQALNARFDLSANSRDHSNDRNRAPRSFNENFSRPQNNFRSRSDNFDQSSRFTRESQGNNEYRPRHSQGNYQERSSYPSKSYVPSYQPTKRTFEQENVNYSVPPPQMPKTDDWEIKTSTGIPSVNVYTKSRSSDWDDKSKPSNSRYQKRDTYGDRSSYTRSDFNYGTTSTEDSYTPSTVTQEKEYEPIDWDKINAEADAARKARWVNCPKLLKDFYEEHEATKAMTQQEVDAFRLENNKIQVAKVFNPEEDPTTMPKPITKFEYCFEAWPDLLNEIKKAGFDKPSPIQSQMWPILMKGDDCIGIAQTGTGKTLAFLLPALIHTDAQPHPRGNKARGGPNVLVLAPTRELAIQIEKEVAKYQFRNIKAVCLYGGNDRKKQIEVVESGVEVIIATPGRLNDLVAAKHIKIESITFLILDEADRMLDMGFEPQIRKLLLDIRDDRQTVMTSATWPSGVRRLASSYMKQPYQVVIGSLDLAATHTVTQRIEIMTDEEKFDRIMHFALHEMTPDDKAIIFCGKKDRADSLSCDFVLKGIKCQAIHGNREQIDREQALDDIKTGEVRILIATDVASRGIDIQDITYVINYDFPRNIEEYVHRVGRTGRAGRSGTSLSFLTRYDWGSAKELIEILKEANQEVPDELLNMAERFEAKKARDFEDRSRGGGGGRGRGRGGRGQRY